MEHKVWMMTLALLILSTTANADKKTKMVVSPGETFQLPAKIGTMKTLLGKGFSSKIKPIDDAGLIPRAYPAKYDKTDTNAYNLQIVIVRNQFQLDAHANYLFARAGATVDSDKRYAVYRGYHIDKVKELKLEGKNNSRAPIVATKIYYGWV